MLDVHWRKTSEHTEEEVFGGSAKTRCGIL